MKHHSEAIDFSNLYFEALHKEMIADEDAKGARANEQVEVEGGGEGKGPDDA